MRVGQVLLLSVLLILVSGEISWSLCGDRIDSCIPVVQFPFSVHETLLGAGLIEDPFNENASLNWIANTNWTLTGVVEEEFAGEDLVISGVTAPADVVIDNHKVGTISSAFLEYRFDVSGGSKIAICLYSPVTAATEHVMNGMEVPQCPPEEQHGFCGIQYLRIPPYLFGWDFGLATASVGIHSIALVKRSSCIDTHDLGITAARNEDNLWSVSLSGVGDQPLRLELVSPSGEIVASSNSLVMSVSNPDLWWPRGYGDQILYTLSVCQRNCACMTKQIGFREISRDENMRISVNGQRVYLKGANVVPTSTFRDSSPHEIEEILEALVLAGANVMRQWGGGWYASEYLLSRTDELGILVWEELKLACATYPVDQDGWMADLESEIQLHIQRARSHPSFAILSGDNEVELMLDQNWYNVDEDKQNLLKQRYLVLRESVHAMVEGMGTFVFIPSSPTAGIDQHYYNYTVDCTDWTTFPTNTTLASEFGYHSACSADVLAEYMQDPALELKTNWMVSGFLKQRQHRHGGNEEISRQIITIFTDPIANDSTVEEFIWFSQISQAICIKSATETFRRQQSNSGVLVWQLNDVWPTLSWSLTHKPAFYAVKSAFEYEFTSLFVDKNDLVIAARREVSGVVAPITVFIVNVLGGEVASFTTGTALTTDWEFTELGRVNIDSVCPKRDCVAAISPTNYILLGPVNRRMHKYASVTNPVLLRTDLSRLSLTAVIPTPFIYLTCKGNQNMMTDNSIFLAPGVWESFEIETVDGTPCMQPEVMSFWNFTREFDTPATYRVELE